jgi:hypothetical protein
MSYELASKLRSNSTVDEMQHPIPQIQNAGTRVMRFGYEISQGDNDRQDQPDDHFVIRKSDDQIMS